MKIVTIALAATALAGAGAAALAQQGGNDTANYWMTADTASGMAVAMGGGAQQDPQAMLRAMQGGEGSHAHVLALQLGSGRRAPGTPAAEHLPPTALGAGPSLPLVTPNAAPRPDATPSMVPQGMARPQGRMLVYWGCGEHARPGQPLVVDFAQMTAGKVPAAFQAANVTPLTPPGAGRAATFGEWPNARSQARVPASGSLVGDHVVRGNYTPEIKFSLTRAQDFLAPVRLNGSAPAASGAVPLGWAPVPGARAWLATVTGANEAGDVVMWSSSEREALPMALAYGHLSDADIARLVRDKVLMPGEADRCAVPAEVARASQSGMLTLAAFGGEADFSHPARPARAPASWRPEWTVKLLRKSTHMGMLGMDMSGMMGAEADLDEEEAAAAEPAPREGVRKRLRRGLGRILGQ